MIADAKEKSDPWWLDRNDFANEWRIPGLLNGSNVPVILSVSGL
jgi:hypothetical protein